MQRACHISWDELNCRPVSRRSVGHVRTRATCCSISLIHHGTSSMRAEDEPITLKFCATAQKVSKSGFFWNDKQSRFSHPRSEKARIPSRLWQKKYLKVEWNDRVSKKSCSSMRRTTSTRSTTSSRTVIEAKLGSPWSSWEKVSMKWKNWQSGYFFDTNARRKLLEDQILSLNSQATFRISRMKWIVWTIRGDFHDVQHAVDILRHSLESEQIRIFLERQKEQILVVCQANSKKPRISSRLWQKKYLKVEWNDRVTKKSCSSMRRTTSTRSTTSSRTVIEAKLGSPWSSWEKVSMKWKNWQSFRVISSTLTREENLSKFEILSLNSQATFRISRMKWIVWTIQEIFMMFSTQWTFPRYKSNNVIHSFNSCGNANA